jgi:hypothetical protein
MYRPIVLVLVVLMKAGPLFCQAPSATSAPNSAPAVKDQLRQKVEAARSFAEKQQLRATATAHDKAQNIHVGRARLSRRAPTARNVLNQTPNTQPIHSTFQQIVRSRGGAVALVADALAVPISPPQSRSALPPLATELVTEGTASSQAFSPYPYYFPPFGNAMDDGAEGAMSHFMINRQATPIGSFMIPFFVKSPNLTFRVPAYIMGPIQVGYQQGVPLMTPNNSGPYPITITLEKLELTPAHLPIQDSNDLFGYKWTSISPSISTGSNIPQPSGAVDMWYNSLFVLSNPAGRTYSLARMRFGNQHSTYLDVPANLTDVVNILRFSIVVHVNPTTAWTYYSGAVPVIVEPTGLVQLKCLPIAILYQPPGDESVVDYSQSKTATAGITANFGVGTSTKFTNDVSAQANDDSRGGLSFSIPFFGPIGIGRSGTQDAYWDDHTTKVDAVTTSASNGLTISTNVSGEWQLGGNPPSGLDYAAPYWNDTFILTVHPQFALWDFMQPTQGNNSANGVVADLLGLDLDGTMSVTVKQLDACANDQNVVISIYTGRSGKTEYLKQPDCKALLVLDPFYIGGQSSAPSDIAVQQSAFNIGSAGFSDTIKLTSTLQTGETTKLGTSYSSEVDSTQGGGYKFGYTWQFGAASGNDASGGSGSTTTGTSVDFSYSNEAQLSNAFASSASRKLQDSGSKGQLPIKGSAFVDRRFGTWMFEGASPQTCFSNGEGDGCSTPCSNQRCDAPCKLASAAGSQYVCPAVGSETGTWSTTAPANAKCGDTIVINGFGLSEVKEVLFEPEAGDSQVVVSPQSSIKIQSDDLVSARLNAPGDRTYKVAVKTFPTSDPVVVGEISVTGACSAGSR